MFLRLLALAAILALPLSGQVSLTIVTSGAVARSTPNGPACFPCTSIPACPSSPSCICPFYAYIDAIVTPLIPQGTRLLMLTRQFDLAGIPIQNPGGEWIIACDTPTVTATGAASVTVRTEVQIGSNEPGSWFGGEAFEAVLILVQNSSPATPGTFWPSPSAVPGFVLASFPAGLSVLEASAAPFGDRCPVGTGPTLRGIGGAPAPGNSSFQLELANAQPNAACFVWVGLPDANGSFSVNGCDIYMDLNTFGLFLPVNPFFQGLTDSIGRATFPLPTSGFSPGTIVAFQGFILDATLTFTDGLLVSVY